MAFPGFVGPVHRDQALGHGLNLVEFVLEKELSGLLGSVEDFDVAEFIPAVEDVLGQRAQRGHTQPAGGDEDVLPLHRLDGEPLAVRPPDAYLVAGLEAMEGVGHVPHRPDAQLEGMIAGRR